MKKVLDFFNSSAGLVILGFIVTTGGGSILNYIVQSESARHEQSFQMYKTRLEQAESLQKDILEHAATRLFYIQQIYAMLDDPNQKLDDIRKFWREKYSNVKDDWNVHVYLWQSQMKVLFKGNVDELLINDDQRITHTSVEQNLIPEEYLKHRPVTVHDAFVDTHNTIYHMAFKCQDRENCQNWNELLGLVQEQINRVVLLDGCLSSRISGELLVDPYGPQQQYVLPAKCHVSILDARKG